MLIPIKFGAHDRIRTYILPFRRRLLIQLSYAGINGATERNRTSFNGSSPHRYDHISYGCIELATGVVLPHIRKASRRSAPSTMPYQLRDKAIAQANARSLHIRYVSVISGEPRGNRTPCAWIKSPLAAQPAFTLPVLIVRP